jgi:K+-sensing histidine kinase KdpD
VPSGSRSDPVAGVIGALAVIVIAGILVPIRDEIGNTNIALILVVVIVGAAALGGRLAGAMTAGVAALSFNYFHTEPYNSLRIKSEEDIWTVVLLFVVGIAVGELALLGRTHRNRASMHQAGARRLERIAALVAEGAPTTDVWHDVRGALQDELRLREVRFESGQSLTARAEIGREGQLEVHEMRWTPQGMELPSEGVEVPVRAGGRTLGHLVLVPTAGAGTTREQRRVAVALSDQLAIAMSRDPVAGDLT